MPNLVNRWFTKFVSDTTSQGIFWMIMSGICFVAVTALVRFVGPGVPAAEAAFIRYGFGSLMLLPVLLNITSGRVIVFSWNILIIRGISHGAGVALWFYAMARIPIAEVTALGYLTPILVTIGAALFFKERLHTRRLAAIAFGLLGVFTIIRPGLSTISDGQIAQLLATPLFAISILYTKKLTGRESLSVIVAVLSVVCTIMLLPLALVQWVTPSLNAIILLFLTALMATLGHYTMTQAIKLAPLAVLQPASFLQLLWATLLGATLFGDAIDVFVIIGGTIMVASVSYIAHREAVAGASKS